MEVIPAINKAKNKGNSLDRKDPKISSLPKKEEILLWSCIL